FAGRCRGDAAPAGDLHSAATVARFDISGNWHRHRALSFHAEGCAQEGCAAYSRLHAVVRSASRIAPVVSLGVRRDGPALSAVPFLADLDPAGAGLGWPHRSRADAL